MCISALSPPYPPPLLFVTTVHKDVSERLKKLNPQLYVQVKKVLDVNKQERHIRGGMATRRKYLLCKHTDHEKTATK